MSADVSWKNCAEPRARRQCQLCGSRQHVQNVSVATSLTRQRPFDPCHHRAAHLYGVYTTISRPRDERKLSDIAQVRLGSNWEAGGKVSSLGVRNALFVVQQATGVTCVISIELPCTAKRLLTRALPARHAIGLFRASPRACN